MRLEPDTTSEARRIQIRALRRLGGPDRLLAACEMSDDARAVTLAGIQHRHPEWTAGAVHRELLRLMLGPDLARTVLERSRSHG